MEVEIVNRIMPNGRKSPTFKHTLVKGCDSFKCEKSDLKWTDIRQDLISGNITQLAMAKKYNVPVPFISKCWAIFIYDGL